VVYVVPVVNVPVHSSENECNEESNLLFEASTSFNADHVFPPTSGGSEPVSVLLTTPIYCNEVRREIVVEIH
jgi:hypothetical protein